jgi:hypothetical protein
LHRRLSLGDGALSYILTGADAQYEYHINFPARKLATTMEWEDLVLHESTAIHLKELLTWPAHGRKLVEELEMAKNIQKGYRALFYGPSGTGKILMAALFGKRINKPVYRIDLAQLVSKYIEETEKNLEKIFSAAELGNLALSIPGMIPELIEEGKNQIYNKICEVLQQWADKDAFNQGKDVGVLLGQVLFEIIIAILGTKGVDKLAKVSGSGKLATLFKNGKLMKLTKALDKLVELKNRLYILLKGTKYDDVIKLLSGRKNIIVEKTVKELAEKGLQQISEEVTELTIKKVIKESLKDIENETEKKYRRNFLKRLREK